MCARSVGGRSRDTHGSKAQREGVAGWVACRWAWSIVRLGVASRVSAAQDKGGGDDGEERPCSK